MNACLKMPRGGADRQNEDAYAKHFREHHTDYVREWKFKTRHLQRLARFTRTVLQLVEDRQLQTPNKRRVISLLTRKQRTRI